MFLEKIKNKTLNDYAERKNIMEKQELLTTDKNGYIKLKENKKNEVDTYL